MSKGLALPSRSDVKAIGGRQAFLGAAPYARGWGFGNPNFSNAYTVMNNDLNAVITGSKSMSGDALRRRRSPEGQVVRTARTVPCAATAAQGTVHCMATDDRDRSRAQPLRTSLRGARLREAGVGYAFVVAADRRSSGCSSSTRSSTRSTSASTTGGSSGRAGRRPGPATTARSSHDPVFHTALKNIAEYTVGVVPLEMALGLSLALIVNQKLRGERSSARRSTSRRSPRRSRSPRSSSTSSARRAVQPHLRPQHALVRPRRAPRSGRSSA